MVKRIFVVDRRRCQVSTCGRPCISKCPVNIQEKRKKKHLPRQPVPIRFKKSTGEIIIKSEHCLACGICANACPAKAIHVKHVLEEDRSRTPFHQYKWRPDVSMAARDGNGTGGDDIDGGQGNEGFRVYGFPTMAPGRVIGLCGPNGIGKSTILDILAGRLVPNFGNVDRNEDSLDTELMFKHLKDHEMRRHLTRLHQGSLRVAYKQQVLRVLFDRYRGKTIGQVMDENCEVEPGFKQRVLEGLSINAIKDRYLDQCSGGELQRFAIALVLVKDADAFLVDEPCTFLDMKKRVALAGLLRELAAGTATAAGRAILDNAREKGNHHGNDEWNGRDEDEGNDEGGKDEDEDDKSVQRWRDGTGTRPGKERPVLVVEHDLAILDFVSDAVQLFYGVPHEFGVLTRPQSTKAGINSLLEGRVKGEDVQFREKKISFKRTAGGRRWDNARVFMDFGRIVKRYPGFHLEISSGVIYMSEILCIVGENGLGKTTFAKILAGVVKPDEGSEFLPSDIVVSYKPQYITRDHDTSVKDFIINRSGNYDFSEPMLRGLYRPLGVDRLFDENVQDLSGGELQRVFITSCLAKRADLYILDEPSAYLDVEERLHVSGVIRAATKHAHATTICIEHDVQIADALADRILLFKGIPGKEGRTAGPMDKHEGMNAFLKELDITFRRDEATGRARINKKGSQKDLYQRATGEYFYQGDRTW